VHALVELSTLTRPPRSFPPAEGHHVQAVQAYSGAITLAPSAALFCNRAFAQLKLENYGNAIEDAEAALKMDPTFVKAYYRKGAALLALGKFKLARSAFATVLKLKPNDKDAAAKKEDADKQVKRAAFEEAIATDLGSPPSFTMDPNAVAVEEGYKGRHLPPFPGAADGYAVRSAASGPGGVAAASRVVSAEALAADPELVNENGLSASFVLGMMADFKAQRLLHRKYVVELLCRARRHFASLPTLVPVAWPVGTRHVNVCGDTHGQYYDTVNIFENQAGIPGPTNPFVFNGDFVDRGSWSVENVLLLFAWMLLYPRHVFLTRGNHETRNMNRMYGFDGEVKAKYEAGLIELFTEVFRAIPLAVVIDKRVLVVHGGLPTVDNVSLEDMARIDRFREPPESGLMSDLLWSDPQPFPGRGPSKRGVGKSFGPDITAAFLSSTNLDLLIRSHEVRDEGYLVEHDGKCITVFSAPNYCGECTARAWTPLLHALTPLPVPSTDAMGNKGGIVRLVRRERGSGAILEAGEAGENYHLAEPLFITFGAVAHPPIKPMAYAGAMGGMM